MRDRDKNDAVSERRQSGSASSSESDDSGDELIAHVRGQTEIFALQDVVEMDSDSEPSHPMGERTRRNILQTAALDKTERFMKGFESTHHKADRSLVQDREKRKEGFIQSGTLSEAHLQDKFVEFVELHKLTKKELKDVVHYSAKMFVRSEVLSQAVDVTSEEFLPFARKYMKRLLHDKLSWVAYSGDDVVGFVFMEDLVEPEGEEGELIMRDIGESLHPKMMPIFMFMEEMKEKFVEHFEKEQDRPLMRGDVAHVTAVGVDHRYKGYSFSVGLIKEAFINAQRNGYIAALGECTGWASQKLVERNKNEYGYVAKKRYADFEYEGKYPLKNAQVPSCIQTSTYFSNPTSLEGIFQDLCFFFAMYRNTLLKKQKRLQLLFYGYYMQAVSGDAPNRGPPFWKVKARMMWKAWNAHRGMERRQAIKFAISCLTAVHPDWRKLTLMQFVGLPKDFAALTGDAGSELMWISASQGDKCMRCEQPFTFLFRKRKNCRRCGRLVCTHCSKGREKIPDLGYRFAVRVCNVCKT